MFIVAYLAIQGVTFSMQDIAIIILAAGKSSRMRGRDKLTERIRGVPQIRRIATAACNIFQNVHITIPDVAHPRASYLLGLSIQIIPVPEAHLGMGRSIAAGVGQINAKIISGVMIVPADMPELTQTDLEKVAKAFKKSPKAIIQAITPKGFLGHPVVFPKSTFEQLKNLSGDQGAKSVISLNAHLRRKVILPSSHAKTDLDTPEDWQEWLSTLN